MSTTATLGFASKLFASADGTTYTAIAQTLDLKSPEPDTAKVKITNNDSPGNTQEYVAGLIDPGDSEFETIATPAQMAILYGYFTSRANMYWKETYPDGSGWKWIGFVSKIGEETKTENEAIHAKVSIANTGVALFMSTVS